MSYSSVQSQADDVKAPQSVGRFPLWVSVVVILGTLLTITGAIIGKADPVLLTNGGSVTDAVRVYADYLFARNLALAVMLMFLLAVKARRMLAGFMVLIALIQLIDIGNDLARGAFLLAPGLLVFAIVFLFGAWRLFGQAIWHASAWRDSEEA